MPAFNTVKNVACSFVFCLFAASISWSANGDAVTTIDGKFIRFADQKLQMTDGKGQEHSLLLSLDLKVTCDGEDCTISDLKVGMKIRVTTLKRDKMVATEIEAIDKQQTFANTQDGTLASLTKMKMSLHDINGDQHTYTLSEDVVITLDGVVVKAEDLKLGMNVRVTSSFRNKSVAMRIQSVRKTPDF